MSCLVSHMIFNKKLTTQKNVVLDKRKYFFSSQGPKKLKPKGQIISKCLFSVFTFFQKTKENNSMSSKVEFVCSLFGRNVSLKKSFLICLTFSIVKIMLMGLICSVVTVLYCLVSQRQQYSVEINKVEIYNVQGVQDNFTIVISNNWLGICAQNLALSLTVIPILIWVIKGSKFTHSFFPNTPAFV